MKFKFNSVHAIVGTVVVALVSFSMQGGAQAAGITAAIRPVGQTISSVGGSQTWDFSDQSPPLPVTPPSGVTLTGGAIVSGNLVNQYADPGVGDPYLTVGGSVPPATTATLTFATALKHFGVFWGTPDSYNTLNFYDGASLLASFVPGGAFLTASGSSADARYVDFFADAGTVFDRVEFASTSAAFEADNIAYSKVPTPAMLPAIIGFGLTALKRRKLAAQV
jgi:hypothetical protein